MSKYYQLTIKIVSIITLAAFIVTQCGLGYAWDSPKSRPTTSKLRQMQKAEHIATPSAAAPPTGIVFIPMSKENVLRYREELMEIEKRVYEYPLKFELFIGEYEEFREDGFRMDDDLSEFILVEGKLVGYMVGHKDSIAGWKVTTEDGEIVDYNVDSAVRGRRLAIIPEYRNLGLGTQVVNRLARKAIEHGITKIVARTRFDPNLEENKQSFLQKCGFRIIGTVSMGGYLSTVLEADAVEVFNATKIASETISAAAPADGANGANGAGEPDKIVFSLALTSEEFIKDLSDATNIFSGKVNISRFYYNFGGRGRYSHSPREGRCFGLVGIPICEQSFYARKTIMDILYNALSSVSSPPWANVDADAKIYVTISEYAKEGVLRIRIRQASCTDSEWEALKNNENGFRKKGTDFLTDLVLEPGKRKQGKHFNYHGIGLARAGRLLEERPRSILIYSRNPDIYCGLQTDLYIVPNFKTPMPGTESIAPESVEATTAAAPAAGVATGRTIFVITNMPDIEGAIRAEGAGLISDKDVIVPVQVSGIDGISNAIGQLSKLSEVDRVLMYMSGDTAQLARAIAVEAGLKGIPVTNLSVDRAQWHGQIEECL